MPKVIMHHSENSGVSYYRMWMQAKYLRKQGWDVVSFPDVLPHMTTADWEKQLEGADLFVTQKSDNPHLLALLMAARDIYKIPIVFEIDDDIYDISPNSPAYQFFAPGSPFITMTEMLMENSDAMTVSTEALKRVYSKHNSNIYVLPNSQDPEDWDVPFVKGKASDKLVIGWAGSATHYDDLKILARPIKKLLRNHPNVIFRVLGCLPDFLAGHPQIELRSDWAPIRQWQSKLMGMGFDIAVAPIKRTSFNEGKSDIKWQEYAMIGAPVVASNFGPYKVIKHGVDGLLSADDEYSWLHQMEQLVKDAKLRTRLATNAKKRILKDFNMETNIVKWDAAYKQIIKDFKA